MLKVIFETFLFASHVGINGVPTPPPPQRSKMHGGYNK